MSDRFFTIMIVPERSDRIRKVTLPAWLLRSALAFAALFTLIGLLVVFDYVHMLTQVGENKKLRVENHLLSAEIQSAKNKVESLDQSVGRLKAFAQKLRVISNLDQPGTRRFLEKPPEGLKVGPGSPNEDSGNIEDSEGDQTSNSKTENEETTTAVPTKGSDVHSRLEYQRSKTLLGGEFGADFDTQTLSEQVTTIADASVRLREMAEIEEQNLADIQEHLQDRVYRLLSTPSILPTQGYVSSEFGYRYNPFSGVKTFHAGLDIANHIGTNIFATADGKVTKVGLAGGFGTIVRIDHGYGVVTKFGHNSKVLVKAGQRVKRGDKIAEMGNSGRSTGPHLHYQVEVNGRPVEPKLFILDDMF